MGSRADRRSERVPRVLDVLAPGPSPDTSESIPPTVVALLDAQRAVRAAADRSRSKPILELSLIPDGASTSALFAPAAYAGGFDAIAAGNYQEALARFRAAAARDPLIVDPVSRSEPMSIGIARLRAGRMAEAIAPLESAAAMYRDSSEVHRILGTAYGAIGSDAKAIEHLQLAVRLAPGDERGRLALARAQRDAGRLDEAEQSMRETLTVLPGSAEARWTLAGVLEKAGRGIEAARELQAAGSLTVVAGKAALDWQAAEIYDLHQDFDRVAALLRQRVRLEPNNPMVHKQLGLVQNRLGRSGEAFAELAMVDVLGGADAESLTALGQLLLGADRLEDAESALRRAVAMEPDRQEARYALGRTLVRRGRASEAREQLDAFERIRDRAMDDQRRTFEIDKLRAEAAAQSAAGHFSEVAALWGQIVERMPGVAEFQAAAADALAAIGEFQKAAAASGEGRDPRSRARGAATSRRDLRKAGAAGGERAGAPGLRAANEGSAESPTLGPSIVAGTKMFHLRSTCLVVGLVAASAALHGQEQATVYLSVMDQKGAPVLGVEASDIAISEEAGRSTIQSVRRFSWPLKVTVLVDNGPSTSDALVHYRTGLQKFFAGLPSDVPVSLIALAPNPRWLIRETTDKLQIAKGIGRHHVRRRAGAASATRSSNTPTVSATNSEA